MNDGVKIVSLNARGLGTHDPRKRRDVLNYLRKKGFSIICVQDTHKAIENTVRNEWGYKAFFSSYSSASRGVAIFFNNNFEHKVHGVIKDANGNFLILNVTVDGVKMSIINIYAPNTDDPNFFIKVKHEIARVGNKNIMVMGDWNLLLDPEIDGVNYKNINNKKARAEVGQMMADLDLFDIWREEHPEERKYTWKRKLKNNTIQLGRLDFILASQDIIHYCKKENILPGYRSDHSMITVTLQFAQNYKPKTFWKLKLFVI
ncbi:nocturnin [Elysia marginata]|uniref:exodeoxyribonuclease III n=1 Tax=Elysia marginata TaxID=1093978 RepID=A0AAV4IL08_9GAST|nr:nocturnin [Elysia marginata]